MLTRHKVTSSRLTRDSLPQGHHAAHVGYRLWFALKGLHSIPSVSLRGVVMPFLLLSCLPSPTLSLEKRPSILAKVLMMLEIELWTIDPHILGPKMRPPGRLLGCCQCFFPELGSWQSLPIRIHLIAMLRGFPLFLTTLSLPTSRQSWASLEQRYCTRKLDRRKSYEPCCSELASPKVGSSLAPPALPLGGP